MTYFELILTAIGLGMDAFAVSLCRASGTRKIGDGEGYATAFLFGVFQALMTMIGCYGGIGFVHYISGIDHWIGFAILSFIGGRMIYSALFEEGNAGGQGLFELLLLCVATSIDALAVGITLSFLDINIISAAAVIGLVTFILCLIAVFSAHRLHSCSGYKAELAGGIILILIALKLLLLHLEIISM